MIELLIVDDQDLVRTGLRYILETHPEISRISEASSGERAVQLCREARPSVVLLDISLPGLSGFETTRRLRRAHDGAGVIILASHAKAPYPTRLLDAGASGYLTKDCEADELIDAVRTVHSGHRYIGSEAAKQMALSILPGRGESPFEELSAREMEVMLKLTEGSRITDIASLMCLSPKTIATYKYRIYDKLGTRSEVELMRMAMRYGIVEAS